MFIRLENIYSSELGKFWEMADDTTKQISAYRLALRNIVHTAFLALSMNSIIHVFFTKAYREGQSGKETERNSFPQEIEATGAAGKIMPAFQINHDYHGKTTSRR